MKNNKKSLWLLALSATLGFSFLGCNDKGTTGTTGTTGAGDKNIKVHDWIQVQSLPNLLTSTKDIGLIAVSKDEKFLYATNNTAAFAVADITAGIDDLAKDAKWTPKTLTPTIAGGGAATPGKETDALAPATGRIKRFSITEKGVLISIDAGAAAATSGAIALLIGSDYKAAWKCLGAATHLDAACDAQTTAIYGGVLKNAAGKEFVYAAPIAGADEPTALSTSTTALDATYGNGAKLDDVFARTTPFVTTPAGSGPLWFVNANGKAMIIAKDQGISIYVNDGHIGGSQTIPNPVAGGAQVAQWKVPAGAAPTVIKDVVALGTKVYIALDNGVYVYNDATPTVPAAPAIDATWSPAVDIKHLALDAPNNKVYAVLADGLFDCTDGKKAAKAISANPKPTDVSQIVDNGEYDVNSKMPTANITDAKFVKGNLVIATSDNGLLVRKAATSQTVK